MDLHDSMKIGYIECVPVNPVKSVSISTWYEIVQSDERIFLFEHTLKIQIQTGDTTIILDIVIKKIIQVHQPETNPIYAASSQLFPDPWCKSKNIISFIHLP
jgi:hypothetical protein